MFGRSLLWVAGHVLAPSSPQAATGLHERLCIKSCIRQNWYVDPLMCSVHCTVVFCTSARSPEPAVVPLVRVQVDRQGAPPWRRRPEGSSPQAPKTARRSPTSGVRPSWSVTATGRPLWAKRPM